MTNTDVDVASRQPWRRALATTIVVALLAGIVALVVEDGEQDPSWDERIAPIAAFVEETRGLRFRRPVPVDFLPRAAFQRRLQKLRVVSDEDRRDLERTAGAMRAVGLLPIRVDAAAAVGRIVQQEVSGEYDRNARRVYVRGERLTPYVRVILAHELTHVLQDQHFDLGRIEQLEGAPAQAATALVEGDAVRVQLAYAAQLSPTDHQRYLAAADEDLRQSALPGVPDALLHSFQFPYAFGPTFAEAVARAGGNPALDRALTRLPRSEAEIVSPQRYLSRVPLAMVEPPVTRAGEKRVWAPGELGQVSLLEILGNVVGYTDAWRAVRRWRGDEWVLLRRGATSCVAIAVAVESRADADAFAAVARRWAATLPGATVTTAGRRIELRSCEPAAAPPRPAPATSAWEVLAARAGLVLVAMSTRGTSPTVAACAADRVIRTLGDEATSRLIDADAPVELLTRIPELTGDAATACARRRPATVEDLIA